MDREVTLAHTTSVPLGFLHIYLLCYTNICESVNFPSLPLSAHCDEETMKARTRWNGIFPWGRAATEVELLVVLYTNLELPSCYSMTVLQ